MSGGDKDSGSERQYLKVFETLPLQCLNAYGEHKMTCMTDKDLWAHMSKPLKSGAKYMTEPCDESAERRGIGLNRWLLSVKEYCGMQLRESVKKANEFILKPELFNEVYQEIHDVLPHLAYCLAPKKTYEKSGSSAVRSATRETATECKARDELFAHAKFLYEWLDTLKVSCLRMLMNWQSGDGQPYVSSVYHRASQCFRYYGNQAHVECGGSTGNVGVTLLEFQQAVVSRHALGCSGVLLPESDGHTQPQDYVAKGGA